MNYIVITSINIPTPAVKAYAELPDFHLVVVGDRKSPKDWECGKSRFLSLDEQKNLGFTLESFLPENHYCRKMLGYLLSIESGARVIVDTDDDNIPKDEYFIPDFNGEFSRTEVDLNFINIYNLFSDQAIWPRGLPIDQIQRNDSGTTLRNGKCSVGIFQGLADGDPDVDAIYRLTSDADCNFYNREPIVLAKGTIAPFNSQNTFFKSDLFPLLYLPTTVTFRFTDILRGLVAQPIMWELGYELAFSGPSVVQIRNPHDYFQDFLSEIPMYVNTRKVIELVNDSVRAGGDIFKMLFNAYAALERAGIVEPRELECLAAWISDMKKVSQVVESR
jgi:hypothetical protein